MVLMPLLSRLLTFFFQAEDGIRYLTVTGVQTCALPIYAVERPRPGRGIERRDEQPGLAGRHQMRVAAGVRSHHGKPERHGLEQGLRESLYAGRERGRGGEVKIGRASCRERV